MTAPQTPRPRKSFWTPARLALTIAALALFAAFGVSSCGKSPSNEAANANGTNPAVTVSRGPAPAQPPTGPIMVPAAARESSLETIDGKSLKLSDYSGKVVVVNIWATWCGPCRSEMPELVRLYEDYKNKGVTVIGMATRPNDPDIGAVRDYIKQQKVTYPVVYDDGAVTSALVQSVSGRGVIPQSFVISPSGKITKHFQGFNPATTPAKLREAVEDAMKEKG